MKNQDATIRVLDLFDFYSEAKGPKKLPFHLDWIIESRRSHDLSWRPILDPEKQMPSAFVCQGHAVFVKLVTVELNLGFLEFQALVFRRRSPPRINLLNACSHGSELGIVRLIGQFVSYEETSQIFCPALKNNLPETGLLLKKQTSVDQLFMTSLCSSMDLI
jgi:hypothetical protein